MKYSVAVLLILLTAACSTTTSSEATGSTEVTVDTMAMATSDPIVIDTTYTEVLEVETTFTTPQLNERTAYVYSTSGLDVFESVTAEKVIGHVDYGAKISLTKPLVNSVPADTMRMIGLRGHLAEMTFEGKQAFIFTGYLVNLPVPDGNSAVIDYLTKHLQLVSPATRTTHECDCESMSASSTYEFEKGISFSENSGYESYDNFVLFKNKMTLQEVYLFSTYFFKTLATQVIEYPVASFKEEKEGGIVVTVTAKGEYITSVVVETGEGCYGEEGIHEADDHIRMSANGGC